MGPIGIVDNGNLRKDAVEIRRRLERRPNFEISDTEVIFTRPGPVRDRGVVHDGGVRGAGAWTCPGRPRRG